MKELKRINLAIFKLANDSSLCYTQYILDRTFCPRLCISHILTYEKFCRSGTRPHLVVSEINL